MRPSSKQIALLALGVAALAAVFLAIGPRSQAPPQIAGFVYPEPRAISPFRLTQHDGSPFDLETLRGKWSFVFFGYTYCPDVCPTTLAELSRAQQLLETAGDDADNRYFFVSVDPKRDTPARLAQYTGHFNKKIVGVSGDAPALKQFTHPIGVAYAFPDGTSGERYGVDHSSVVALFGPDARLHAVFTAPHRAETLVDGFRKILQR